MNKENQFSISADKLNKFTDELLKWGQDKKFNDAETAIILKTISDVLFKALDISLTQERLINGADA